MARKLIEEVKLSKSELATFNKFLESIEQAAKNPVEFGKGGQVMFTPAAALGIAVAKFVYDVVKDYYHSWLVAPELNADFTAKFKAIAKELNQLEKGNIKEAPSLKTLTKMRKEVLEATKK